MFLLWVFLSSEKAYSSFPLLKNLELILFINTLLLHGLNPRPSLYNISAKNHLNCLKNLLFESLFLWVFVAIFGCGNIFDQRLLFVHKQLCIWPLELSEHYEPRNHSKNQRLKPLRNNLNVSHAKFDVRDFWTWESRFYKKWQTMAIIREISDSNLETGRNSSKSGVSQIKQESWKPSVYSQTPFFGHLLNKDTSIITDSLLCPWGKKVLTVWRLQPGPPKNFQPIRNCSFNKELGMQTIVGTS